MGLMCFFLGLFCKKTCEFLKSFFVKNTNGAAFYTVKRAVTKTLLLWVISRIILTYTNLLHGNYDKPLYKDPY